MKVQLNFKDISSYKEQFLAYLFFEVVDAIMHVFDDGKEEDT